MINFSKGQEDWTLRLSEYPKILGTSTYYRNNMSTLGNDRTSGKEYGYWYNEIANTILKKLICEKCGKHTYIIDIVSEKQMNRDKKIKYLLK